MRGTIEKRICPICKKKVFSRKNTAFLCENTVYYADIVCPDCNIQLGDNAYLNKSIQVGKSVNAIYL